MNATLEVVILPVSDPDKSLDFYRDKLGFALDVDYAPVRDFRGLYLVVDDIATVRDDLIDRGVGVSDPDGNTWVLQERGHRDA